MAKFNVNDTVTVKLTPAGHRVHSEHYDSIVTKGLWSEADRQKTIQPLADGTNRFQLWQLMQIFGPAMYHGMPSPMFEKNMLEIERS